MSDDEPTEPTEIPMPVALVTCAALLRACEELEHRIDAGQRDCQRRGSVVSCEDCEVLDCLMNRA